ncbi:hypothetical protein [Pseudalkalibacillus sp. NRS-1564]|uniref:hypothetical protein n=1 Tax=Pseudalkalibacillus sp. NRS-1564 TaxID=3233900 RepID=UPI003D2E557B
MKIKRYVVSHLREAMPLIRQELGQEAVILNTKKVKVGGIFGFFQKQRLEVLAALDEKKGREGRNSRICHAIAI